MDVETALADFSVLSIKGVLIAPSLWRVAAKWNQRYLDPDLDSPDTEGRVDCLSRDPNRGFVASCQRNRLLDELFAGIDHTEVLWLGETVEPNKESPSLEWLQGIRDLPAAINALSISDENSIEPLTTIKRVVMAPHWPGFDETPELQQTLTQWASESEHARLVFPSTRGGR